MERERSGPVKDRRASGRVASAPGSATWVAAALALAVAFGAGCGVLRQPTPAGAHRIAPPADEPAGEPAREPVGEPGGEPARESARETSTLPEPGARPRRVNRHGSWLIAPDAPLPADSRWRPVLAVARRFAAADLSYEVGLLGPAVRGTLARTCTAAFVAALLARPAIMPPGVRAEQVRQRLAGVQPLERLSGAAVVLATLRPIRRGGSAGAFELRLLARGRGWRVAAMTVV
jgi:hypothetical protein